MNVRAWPVGGVALAVLWLFVRGVTLDPLHVVGETLLGLAFGLPVAFLFRRLYVERVDVGRNVRAAPYTVLYVLAFLKELVTANVDVAYRTLAPWMPIQPRVVVVPLRVKTDVAITSIANSITLTPGTLTMDYDPELNALYVHAIDGRDRDAVVAPIRTWEDYALVIFDEQNKPGDPVPDLPASAVEAAGQPVEEARPGDADATRDRRDPGGDRDGE